MNLADYLSELLGQHDEVSVPGLGYFVRERINGYYNDKEARFYPPYHQVKFVPRPREDDDTFTQYVADKKNISLASSKYFAEKFIIKLKEDAAKGKFLFADLGSFQTEQDQLVFKANDKIAGDPSFYGYPPINIYKIGQPVFGGSTPPVFAEPAPAVNRPVVQQPVIQTIEQPEYFEEETERKKSLNIWLILLIIFAALAIAGFGVYKFYPAAFDKLEDVYRKIVHKEAAVAPVLRHEVKTDSVKKTAAADTTSKASTLVADTAKQSRWEVIAAKFKLYPAANAEVTHLKSIGLDAKILTDAPGPYLKVSVGTYNTIDEAEAQRLALVKAGKIKQRSETLEIKSQ